MAVGDERTPPDYGWVDDWYARLTAIPGLVPTVEGLIYWCQDNSVTYTLANNYLGGMKMHRASVLPVGVNSFLRESRGCTPLEAMAQAVLPLVNMQTGKADDLFTYRKNSVIRIRAEAPIRMTNQYGYNFSVLIPITCSASFDAEIIKCTRVTNGDTEFLAPTYIFTVKP